MCASCESSNYISLTCVVVLMSSVLVNCNVWITGVPSVIIVEVLHSWLQLLPSFKRTLTHTYSKHTHLQYSCTYTVHTLYLCHRVLLVLILQEWSVVVVIIININK